MKALGPFILFCALTVPFGIMVHIGAEFAGLGGDAVALSIAPRHAYLLGLALVSLALVARALSSGSRREARRKATRLIASLPFRGTGWRFFVLAYLAQMVFFWITQFGEGCPLCGDDLALGALGALIASAIGAAVLATCKSRIVTFFAALITLFSPAFLSARYRASQRLRRPVSLSVARRFSASLWSRPPPFILSIS